jgi:hypothetical protein
LGVWNNVHLSRESDLGSDYRSLPIDPKSGSFWVHFKVIFQGLGTLKGGHFGST